MSSVHCVVVWEWQCDDQWLPHTPSVARTLERAHAKKLTRVVLADADPELKGHYVNLRTLTQSSDASEGSGESEATCLVRRACYSVQSPGGRGARWEWARLDSVAHQAADLLYTALPMEIQCQLEEAWTGGVEWVWWRGWAARVQRMTARGPAGALRLLRRVPQPPYPLARSVTQPQPPPRPVVRPHIPQQHTGSSIHSVQSAHSAHSAHSAQSAHSVRSAPAPPTHATLATRGGARSASPRDRERKPGLARQILHNLNIFSHSNKPALESQHSTDSEEPRASLENGGRRHSVDTVSTYLSHESKDSLQQASVGSLLNCSAGSDDVFEAPPPPGPLSPPLAPLATLAPANMDNALVGMEGEGPALCVWVGAVSAPHWAAPCPRCRRPLGGAGGAGPGPGGAVALLACQHMMHLHCLDTQLTQRPHEPLYIECLVCGRVYGQENRSEEPRATSEGEQPPGSMAWRLEPGGLPGCDGGSILVTYNFQSGRQSARHPVPGAPYYAVGFPRHSLLPDTPLGREVTLDNSLQPGRQSARHPVPGAPYYAVGFPRHSLLPDTPLGREVTLDNSLQPGRQSARHPVPGAPYYAVGFPRHSLLPDTPLGREVTLDNSLQPGRQSARHPVPGAPYYAVGFPRHSLLPDTPLGREVTLDNSLQPGRQSARHPVPGAPYYAVGFPRHSLLPDTPLGREVLSALRLAWERSLLFTVTVSQTTGREHVVAWRVAPPPAERNHYRAHSPDVLLRAALQRLRALTDSR